MGVILSVCSDVKVTLLGTVFAVIGVLFTSVYQAVSLFFEDQISHNVVFAVLLYY